MTDGGNDSAGVDNNGGVLARGWRGQRPALQVICLGNSGGPCEEDATGFLVRSVSNGWFRGGVLAVDAGSHLAPICRILERDFPRVSKDAPRAGSSGSLVNRGGQASRLPDRESFSPSSSDQEEMQPEPILLTRGPFAGLSCPHESARANALHILRAYVSTYLITHPHLDHLSGFVINTAAFHATSKPKTLAALPSTVDAMRTHIFNDIIWPNLTDEDGGVGFVTFQRLKEGGDVMVGEGEGRGYIDVVEGLGVRAFKVSHGLCTKTPAASHSHRRSSVVPPPDAQSSFHADSSMMSGGRSLSISQQYSVPGTPRYQPRQSSSQYPAHQSPGSGDLDTEGVVDSTAYFIRDSAAQREVLIFGDVEPDSISRAPRNRIVWQEAARKVAHHLLAGIFIECSYDDSQSDATLFGHLCSRHLIAELQTLAGLVAEAKMQRALERSNRKRKRSVAKGVETAARHAMADQEIKRSRNSIVSRPLPRDFRRGSVPSEIMADVSMTSSPTFEHKNPMEQAHHHPVREVSPRSFSFGDGPNAPGHVAYSPAARQRPPLSGIKVVIIHVKDTFKDGPHVSETILAELKEHEARLAMEGQALGCEFVISKSGESYWF